MTDLYMVYFYTDDDSQVMAVFSSYVKARKYELKFLKSTVEDDSSWTEVRKVVLDHKYDFNVINTREIGVVV